MSGKCPEDKGVALCASICFRYNDLPVFQIGWTLPLSLSVRFMSDGMLMVSGHWRRSARSNAGHANANACQCSVRNRGEPTWRGQFSRLHLNVEDRCPHSHQPDRCSASQARRRVSTNTTTQGATVGAGSSDFHTERCVRINAWARSRHDYRPP